MIKKIPLTFLLLSGTLLAKDKCSLFQSEVDFGASLNQLDGYIKIGDTASSTKLDIKKDLSITKQAASLKTMFSHSTSHHKFGFKLEKYVHSGSKKLTSNIVYNSSLYATATLINSKISLKWAKLKYRYRFTKNFSFGADVNALRFKTIVNKNETKKTLLVPAIGIDYEKELESGFGLITNASSTIAGETSYHHAYAGLSYDLKLLHCSRLHLGYQLKNLSINRGKIDLNLKYKGLYAGIAMKF